MFTLSRFLCQVSPALLFIFVLLMKKVMMIIEMMSVHCLHCVDSSVMQASLQVFTLCRLELSIDNHITGKVLYLREKIFNLPDYLNNRGCEG